MNANSSEMIEKRVSLIADFRTTSRSELFEGLSLTGNTIASIVNNLSKFDTGGFAANKYLRLSKEANAWITIVIMASM